VDAVELPSRAKYVPGAAEESDLVRVGDVLLGVSGVGVWGLDPPTLDRVIAAARSVTPGGLVVLHLCDVPVDAALMDEAAAQMAAAAAQLLGGSRQAVEAVQHAAAAAVIAARTSSSRSSSSAAALVSAAASAGAAGAGVGGYGSMPTD